MKVVLDTNAAMLPFSDGTDVAAELERLVGAYELVVPHSVHEELQQLLQGDGANARHARMAMTWLGRAHHEPTDLPGDDGVLDVATRLQAVVLSNDRVLLAEARKRGLRVLRSRGKGRLYDPAT